MPHWRHAVLGCGEQCHRAVGMLWESSSSRFGRCVPVCTLVDHPAAPMTAEWAALARFCPSARRDNSTGELGCDKDCPTVVTVTDDLGRSFKASFEPIKVASGQQRWQQVSAAIYFTCATTVEGTAMCWVRGQPSCNSWAVCSAALHAADLRLRCGWVAAMAAFALASGMLPPLLPPAACRAPAT